MKIGFVSLGCPKNRVDTEIMLHELSAAGYEITAEETEADIIIINTCAFIESAKKEAIDSILDIAWLKKNHTLSGIIVTGCLPERYGEEVLKLLPEVDAVLGVGSIHNIVEAVRSVENTTMKDGKRRVRRLRGAVKYSSILPRDEVALGGDRVISTPDYYAYLKIAEGCDNRCAYCVIPSIRGKFRSRPMEELVEEAVALDEYGVKELCIVAQDITRYGLDIYGKYSLAQLLHKITEATKIPWIRLLYCYPDKITDELIAEIRDNDRILKYIDIPIQHISDNMLSAMNRHGDSEMIKTVIAKLRAAVPGIIIRTTFIVGFPGETEEDFGLLCDFVKETKFERMGAFTYSREEGTPAYDMENQIDEQVKLDRQDILMRSQFEISDAFNKSKIGTDIIVMCEDYDAVTEMFYGRSAADAPDIDGKVYFKANRRMRPGTFVKVRVMRVIDYDLIGEEIVDKNPN